jgi:cytochrome c551/c552
MRKQLTNDQIWAAVAFLESQGGQVTVTGEDIQKTAPAAGSGGATAAPAGPGFTTTMDPLALINEKGCIGCHAIDGKGAAIGPPLDHIGKTKNADYLRRSILTPNADTAKGYEKFAGMMPQIFGQQLSAAQLEVLVQYLASRK